METFNVRQTIPSVSQDERFNISRAFQSFGLMTTSIASYAQKKSSARLVSFFCLILSVAVLVRCAIIMFIKNELALEVMGHRGPGKQTHLTFTLLLWAAYTTFMVRLYHKGQGHEVRSLNWLLSLEVIEGSKPPSDFGLDADQATVLTKRTRSSFKLMWVVALIRSALAAILLANSLHSTGTSWTRNPFTIVWLVILVLWAYLSSGVIYITLAAFDLSSHYFRLRFEKVNDAIQVLLDTRNMSKEHRGKFMSWILAEHNELCVKLTDYNRFISKFLLYSYFGFVSISCFSLYQAIFSDLKTHVKVVMYIAAFESAYMFTAISLNGTSISDEAHSPYGQLIRATFDEYTVELQIQLRLLIQRLSGPPIGYYCADLFEISRTTFFAILLALGQNFLLIVDFVGTTNVPPYEPFPLLPGSNETLQNFTNITS